MAVERDYGTLYISTVSLGDDRGEVVADIIRAALPASVASGGGSGGFTNTFFTVHPLGTGFIHVGHDIDGPTSTFFRLIVAAALGTPGSQSGAAGEVSATSYTVASGEFKYMMNVSNSSFIFNSLESDNSVILYHAFIPYPLWISQTSRPHTYRTLHRTATLGATATAGMTPTGVIGLSAYTPTFSTSIADFQEATANQFPVLASQSTYVGLDGNYVPTGVPPLLVSTQNRPDAANYAFWNSPPYDRLYDPSKPGYQFIPLAPNTSVTTGPLYMLIQPI
jgi:hypothetical protein